METRKIAMACFVGGVLCSLVALLFTPDYWWLGMLAGFAGGYLSYEFQAVLKAIPVALRAAINGKAFAWKSAVDEVREWRSHDHPFAYTGVFLTLLAVVWFGSDFIGILLKDGFSFSGIVAWTIMMPIAFIESIMVLSSPIFLFAYIGVRAEGCCWRSIVEPVGFDLEQWLSKMQAKGYREVTITYANVVRWTGKGVGETVKFFAWKLWKYIAIGSWVAVCFCGRFVWHLFRFIHSKKRVLCGVDGTLGGMVSYFWLISPSASFVEQTLLVVFGGLLGAAFGVANWELVSKRVFKVATSGT